MIHSLRFIFLLTIYLSPLFFSSGARAQLIWKLKHSDVWLSQDKTVDSTICFTAISCSGNVCAASAIIFDSPEAIGRLVFYRSIDGGLSWVEQNPDIPVPVSVRSEGLQIIQQIDSTTLISAGNDGFILRTSDCGKTWQRRDCPISRKLLSMHFSDNLTGVITVAGYDSLIYTTTDGGINWIIHPVRGDNYFSGHSNGDGRFSFLKYGYGPVYRTRNDFNTLDSTERIIDSNLVPEYYRYVFSRCNTSRSGDTILAYGSYWPRDTNNISGSYGLIIRTIDGGKHWEKPYTYPTEKLSSIKHTSSLDRDTIFASGGDNRNFLMSTDRGKTWEVDSIILDTNYEAYVSYGMELTTDGHPVAIFSIMPLQLQSILARGEYQSSHIEVVEKIIYNTYFYPNPTAGLFNIVSIDKFSPVKIIDIFGREIMTGNLSNEGRLILDLSGVSRGVYEVLINHYGMIFSAGKVVVTGH